MRSLLTIFCCSVVSFSALAVDLPKENKSTHWLFNPVPRESMKPLTSDGNRLTSPHTPYTVDAGHVQIENGLNYNYWSMQWQSDYWWSSYTQTVTYETFEWNPAIRIGLHDRVDLKVTATYYKERELYKSESRYSSYGSWHEIDGFAPVSLALKVNVVGSDDGRFALAFEPYANVPVDFSYQDTLGFHSI